MNTAFATIQPEHRMRRLLEPHRPHDSTGRRHADDGAAVPARVRQLPPTRAARTPRSRGLFLAAGPHSRLRRWIINGLCIALAAVSILASVEFAEPVMNAAAVSSNAGPALFAQAIRAPAFLARPK